jgi:hypothetical protein
MHASLVRHCPDFHLYIFAFDNQSYDLLFKMNLKNSTIVSLREFEDPALLDIKGGRTRGEYCWTCTPSIIRYVINTYSVDSCTYVDSDLYFYSNPGVLIAEMGDASVSIIEHRYHPDYDQTVKSGKYCVQFMTFKNNKEGMDVLEWWRNACIDWCFNRFEDGKFGDQKYLDDWIVRFGKAVHEIRNVGAGVAPWNAKRFDVCMDKNKIFVSDRLESNKKSQLVFYHFHGLKVLTCRLIKMTFGGYELRGCFDLIYYPYIDDMKEIDNILNSYGFNLVKTKEKLKIKNIILTFVFGRYKNIMRFL